MEYTLTLKEVSASERDQVELVRATSVAATQALQTRMFELPLQALQVFGQLEIGSLFYQHKRILASLAQLAARSIQMLAA